MALKLHAASLYLYPRVLRDAHGEEMKQAFRDRCREAVAAGRGPIGLLWSDWIGDTVRAVPEAHLAGPSFSSGPRQSLVLGLLCLSLIALLSKDAMSAWVLDHGFALRNQWRETRYRHELDRLEGITRKQAAALAASGNPSDRALAAHLYGSLGPERIVTVDVIGQDYPVGWIDETRGSAADAERSRLLAADALRASTDAYTLALAARACDPRQMQCDRQAILAKWLRVDGDNAYAWELAFSEASRRGDMTTQRQALRAMAHASRYEDYRSRMVAQLFNAAAELDASDAHMAGVAWAQRRAEYGTLQDWYDSVRFACTPQADNASSRPHWVDLHPEDAATCAAIAGRLSRANSFHAAMWGLRRLVAGEADSTAGQAARAQWTELAWLEQHRGGDVNRASGGVHWTPWRESDWSRWAREFRPEGGEIQAMRRWMLARHQPLEPPAWFQSGRN